MQEAGHFTVVGQPLEERRVGCQKDGTVKFVTPLEPLAVRTISLRFLSEPERIQIADLASRSLGPTALGLALGRAPSTISRELRRNLYVSGQYRPFHYQITRSVRSNGSVWQYTQVFGAAAEMSRSRVTGTRLECWWTSTDGIIYPSINSVCKYFY